MRLGVEWTGRLYAALARHFFAGVLVLTPLAAVLWIVWGVLELMWRLPNLLPAVWRPDNLLDSATAAGFLRTALVLAGLLVVTAAVSVLGWLSTRFLGRRVLEAIDEIIDRIPVLRSIYSALGQLLKTMAPGGGRQFRRVVYVEYPRKGLWTLAFVTGESKSEEFPFGHLCIYVPTTPNPTSGFYLVVPESDLKSSNMSVEEAFKTILSLGVAQGGAGGNRRSSSSPASKGQA